MPDRRSGLLPRRLSAAFLSCLLLSAGPAGAEEPLKRGDVSVDSVSPAFRLIAKRMMHAGVAFEGTRADLIAAAAAGVKVVRVYREADVWVLDAADALGLKVVMGLWMAHPRHGFDMSDSRAVAEQEQRLRAFVRTHKAHPALLAWGVGNEVETEVADPGPVWALVDRMAELVKQEDPDHPTLMVVADTGMDRLKLLAGCCRSVDLLGINIYAGAYRDLPDRLTEAGIRKPVVIAELGPLGQWQAGRKPWGAPVELTSRQKADFFAEALPWLRQQAQIVGVFPFLWGEKQEQTATWHSLLMPDGGLTAMTDALSREWQVMDGGQPPAAPAPDLTGVGINADVFAPGAEVSSTLAVTDPQGQTLTTVWEVRQEATDLRKGGDAEAVPPPVAVTVLEQGPAIIRFRAPQAPGAYRLFATVRNSTGKAATANLPFLVR
ncbi:glycoside hydrolase family 2 TIM barrel-domain containing protein [Novispirillum itersonii]|uniref:glycoside hydrolase family 2 TIM barrel-domain containing protein n=1 Tax=Novispirillum itersonii TaxID=189 RepID=UPI0003811E1E|nr:glycoside hydrolase family 2 TIM barrel-domain containing protein [Novispirillum itersonii]